MNDVQYNATPKQVRYYKNLQYQLKNMGYDAPDLDPNWTIEDVSAKIGDLIKKVGELDPRRADPNAATPEQLKYIDQLNKKAQNPITREVKSKEDASNVIKALSEQVLEKAEAPKQQDGDPEGVLRTLNVWGKATPGERNILKNIVSYTRSKGVPSPNMANFLARLEKRA